MDHYRARGIQLACLGGPGHVNCRSRRIIWGIPWRRIRREWVTARLVEIDGEDLVLVIRRDAGEEGAR